MLASDVAKKIKLKIKQTNKINEKGKKFSTVIFLVESFRGKGLKGRNYKGVMNVGNPSKSCNK